MGGRHDGPHGAELIISVREPAVDGRATEAARKALAAALSLRPAQVALRTGAAGRDKLFTVTDPPPDLASRVAALRDPGSDA